MSTAAVSSNSVSTLQQYFQTRQGDLKQLAKALGSGDVAGAQAEFDSIVKLGQSGPSAKGNPFLIQQRETDFAAIGAALQAGDLAGAQKAFSDLKATVHPGSGPPPGAPPPQDAPNTAQPGLPSAASGAEIVLSSGAVFQATPGRSSGGAPTSGPHAKAGLSVTA